MALGQWAVVQSGQSADLRVPSGNFLWPTIRIMNPNDGVLYIKQNAPIIDSGYGSWDYKVPAQSFGILPSEGVGWQSAGIYYLDQSGTNRPGEVAMYLSMQTVAEPTFLAIGRSIVAQSSSVDIASGNQPANPGAGYGRLWIDTSGHLNVLQPSGTNYLEIDNTNIGAQAIGGDLSGTIGNAVIHLRNSSVIYAYDSGGTLRNYLSINTNEQLYWDISGTNQWRWVNQGNSLQIAALTANGLSLTGSAGVELTLIDSSIQRVSSNYLSTPGDFRMQGRVLIGTSANPDQSGDLGVSRNAAPTTGAIYFGNSGANYLYWDSNNFNLTNQLIVPSETCNGGLSVAGTITLGSCSILNSGGNLYVRPQANFSVIIDLGQLLVASNVSGTSIVAADNILCQSGGIAIGGSMGGGWPIAGDLNVQRGSGGTGYVFVGNNGHYFGFDGNVLVGNGAGLSLTHSLTINSLRGVNQGNVIFRSSQAGYDIQVFAENGNMYFWPNAVSLSYNFQANVNAGWGYLNAAGYTVASAQALKKNIVPLDHAISLKQVLDERAIPISFQYNWGDETPRLGFIAENLNEVVPEAVSKQEDNPFGINYGELTTILWSAFRAFYEEVNTRLDAAGIS